MRSLLLQPLAVALLSVLAACSKEPELVVYCALDQVFSEALLAEFEAETGLRVRAEFDVEASKTVGLVRRLIEEHDNTRCDVFWNNEIAHTARLAERGMLMAYDSPSAASIPEVYRDPSRRWTGFAARARVFIVNTELADPQEITGMWDLLDERWAGKVGMAKPLTGTTLTHATALYDVLGPVRAQEYLGGVAAAGATGDVRLVGSNGQVMRLVAEGQLAWGWTDTDDFNVALEKGHPVAAVYPDQESFGTLLIPNTVAILKKAPHPEAARRLVDWILSEETEAKLAASRSAQIPVRASVPRPDHVRSPDDIQCMQVSYVSLGMQIERRAEALQELFLR